MTKLHQVVAVLNGKKTKTIGEITELHHKTEKSALFSGQSRTYRPNDDGGEKLPDETTLPQERADDIVSRASQLWADFFDLVLTIDTGSAQAKADVVVDGQTIIKNAPVLHLIFMEQQLNDIRKFTSKIPVLDTNYQWKRDEAKGFYVTDPVEQNRSIKTKQVIKLAAATDKHPEQAQLIDVDKWVGVYTSTRFGTGVLSGDKRKWLDRVDKLIDAVKTARELANSIEVENRKEAAAMFKYIFGA